MTAQPDNAALIAQAREMTEGHRQSLREEGQFGTTALWIAKREHAITLLSALAAALAAAEERARMADSNFDMMEAYRAEVTTQTECAEAAEERAQAAEYEIERAHEGMAHWLAAANAAEAQVRELREALERIADPQSELAGGRVRAGAKTPTEIARAVLARSARRAET